LLFRAVNGISPELVFQSIMWQRFTEDARRVILLAQQEAMRAQSREVDTEHLLLGVLLVDEERIARMLNVIGREVDTEHLLLGVLLVDEERIARMLNVVGIEAQVVRLEAMRAVDRIPKDEETKEPKLSPTSKQVLEFAADEARKMQHGTIEVEHLLLGLLHEERGGASKILQTQGGELEKLRVVVAEQLTSLKPKTDVPLHKRLQAEIENNEDVAEALERALHWAKTSRDDIRFEHLLLGLLERREDLWVEITGLDVLALKKARLKLLIGLDFYEEAAQLRDEIRSEQI